jgi:hypothetical protein
MEQTRPDSVPPGEAALAATAGTDHGRPTAGFAGRNDADAEKAVVLPL